MCHGLPRLHQCSHTSLTWNYCLGAVLDLSTGYASPCAKKSIARLQPTMGKCQLKNCYFMDLGSQWTCCMCNNGPNEKGWCEAILPKYVKDPETHRTKVVETFCSHGCCANCIRGGPTIDNSDPPQGRNMPSFEGHRSKNSRHFDTEVYHRGSSAATPATSARRTGHSSYTESSYDMADDLWASQQQQQSTYSAQEGYEYCEYDEYGTDERVWSKTSPCSSRTSGTESSPSSGGSVVLDYSAKPRKSTKGKRRA
ncbi:hypothetical protein Cpir12675_006448 [Ceratocystis pirilliformis]|uniref:Uncharacterized protein n=1 Tax=Ceratocystis pirilliformis TaxID=259994 RepID=A0ABR3YJS9_9PEZI